MKKLFALTLMIKLVFAYALVVNTKKDVEKMAKIGIVCKYDKKDNFYVCTYSKNLSQLEKIRDFLNSQYGIKSYISTLNINKNIKTVSNTVTKKPEKKIKEKIKTTKKLVKSGYCIQVLSSDRLIGNKYFDKYKNYPLTRIEKIGKYYVLRIGEGDYRSIKNLNRKIHGFVRKCDLIPSRIIKSNFSINNIHTNVQKISAPTKIQNSNQIINNIINNQSQTDKYTVSNMYAALNEGDLVTAQRIALKLIKKDPQDAYQVLGIIAMKKNKWGKACNYLSKTNAKKLKITACYTYELKKGYKYLNINPAIAKEYFYKACRIKNDINCKVGIGYSYLNMKEYKKAKEYFANLYKEYPNNENVIKGYILALANLKDYKTLAELKQQLPPKYQGLLKNYELQEELQKANLLIKEGKYDEAENMLLNLYRNYPSNVYVLLSLGNLYLQENKLDKSEQFYKNVLLLSPDNIYALEGLKAVYEKKREYAKALNYAKRIESLGFQVKDKKKLEALYYMQKVQSDLKAGKCTEARKYISEFKSLNLDNVNYYLMMGDFYSKCMKNPQKAYEYYAKAYELDKNNFDVTLKFLYSLLNFDMFEQIKIILSEINPKTLTVQQKEKLKKFYKDLYTKYASYLFNQKEYKKAIQAADEGLKFGKNAALYQIKGWSCYKLKNYQCAKESFLMAEALSPSDNNKLALALTYINLGDKRKAEDLLDEISDTKDENLRIKIANAYLQLGDIDKAKKLEQSIQVPKQREKIIITPSVNKPVNNQNQNEFFPDILNNSSYNGTKRYNKFVLVKKVAFQKKKFDYEEYEKLKEKILNLESKRLSNIEADGLFRFKSGSNGKDRLDLYLFDIKGNYYFDYYKKAYFKLGILSLNSHKPDNYNDIGSPYLGVVKYPYKTTYTGLIPKIGYEYDANSIFDVEIGTTPLGNNEVSPTLTGKVLIGKTDKNKKYTIFIKRDSVKDSLLSYVGNIDPYSGKKWGRIVADTLGGEYEKKLDSNDSMIYTSLSVSLLEGKNVKTNNNLQFIFFPDIYWGSYFLNQDYLGIFTMLSFYNRNENEFYYGNGGYFSPKYFILLGPRYEGYWFSKNNKFGCKLFVMPGFAFYKEMNSQTTMNIDMGLYGEYLLSDRLLLKGGLDLRYAKYFSDQYFHIGLEYLFGKKVRIYKKELNKNLKGIIEIW